VFIFRNLFGFLFLAILGLGAHLTWFANKHHGSDRDVEYWPHYCVLAPVTTDMCATVLDLAHYFGFYSFSFGQLQGSSGKRLVRIGVSGDYQYPLPLPVVAGTLEDPDSEAAQQRKQLQRDQDEAHEHERQETLKNKPTRDRPKNFIEVPAVR
jgi:hypothetical protein